jgi:hypothetical protein
LESDALMCTSSEIIYCIPGSDYKYQDKKKATNILREKIVDKFMDKHGLIVFKTKWVYRDDYSWVADVSNLLKDLRNAENNIETFIKETNNG